MSNSNIHPTAVISKQAEIAADVKIGPFCVLQGKVKIDAGSVLESHVVIGNEWGSVEIGKNNRFAAGAAVGGPPQDLSYKGEPTRLIIGDSNTVREFATLNCGTVKGGGLTQIGSNCLIMAYAHIGHDCTIGSHVVIANSNQLAGHVVFEDHVKTGGMCGFNQHVRIGKHTFIAGDSAVNKDVCPFTIAQGKYAVMRAPNSIGMDRAGFSKLDIENVRRAVRILTKGGGTIDESIQQMKAECEETPAVKYFIDFLEASVAGPRGIAI